MPLPRPLLSSSPSPSPFPSPSLSSFPSPCSSNDRPDDDEDRHHTVEDEGSIGRVRIVEEDGGLPPEPLKTVLLTGHLAKLS